MFESRPSRTRVKGKVTVTNPTASVLESLFSWLIADRAELNPASMAEHVMESVGRATSHQIGPGLEAVTEDDQSVVTVKWERWFEDE